MIDPRSYEALGAPFDDVDGRTVNVTAGPHRGKTAVVQYQTGYSTGRGVCFMAELPDASVVELAAADTDLPDNDDPEAA